MENVSRQTKMTNKGLFPTNKNSSGRKARLELKVLPVGGGGLHWNKLRACLRAIYFQSRTNERKSAQHNNSLDNESQSLFDEEKPTDYVASKKSIENFWVPSDLGSCLLRSRPFTRYGSPTISVLGRGSNALDRRLPYALSTPATAMRALAQLKLLLRKTLVVRRRRPVLLILELCWPVFVFLVVVSIRLATRSGSPKPCAFAPRALPSGDLFSFLQSFVCNVDNACSNETYDTPYSKSGRHQLSKFERLINDEKIGSVLRDLPLSLQLVNFIRDTLSTPQVAELLAENFTVQSFLKYPGEFQSYLINQIGFSPYLVEAFYQSSPNFVQIFHLPNSTNQREENTCSSPNVLSYLKLPPRFQSERKNLERELCSRSTVEWTQMLTKFSNALDFSKIIRTLSKLSTVVGDYSLAEGLRDIAAMLDTVDRLKSTNSLAGSLTELKQTFRWIPDVFKIGSTLKNPAVDLNFLKSILSSLETKLPRNNSAVNKLTDALSLSREVAGFLKQNTNPHSNPFSVGSIFDGNGFNLEKLLNVNDDISNPVSTIPSIENDNGNLFARNSSDLQRLFCQSKNLLGGNQTREWRKVICSKNSTQLWTSLAPYIRSSYDTIENNKGTSFNWTNIANLVEMLNIGNGSTSSRDVKVVKRALNWRETYLVHSLNRNNWEVIRNDIKNTKLEEKIFGMFREFLRLLNMNDSNDSESVVDAASGFVHGSTSQDNTRDEIKTTAKLIKNQFGFIPRRIRRMNEPFGLRLIEECEHEQRPSVLLELPVVSRYMSFVTGQLQNLSDYKRAACDTSSKTLRDLYDGVSSKLRLQLRDTMVNRPTEAWKDECTNYVKNLERLFDAAVNLSRQVKSGLGDQLLECLKSTDDRLFKESGTYLDFFSAFGKLIAEPNVFKNVQQIEPSLKYFFDLVERNMVIATPFVFALKDDSETRRQLEKLISADYLSSLLKATVDLKQLLSIGSREELLTFLCSADKFEMLTTSTNTNSEVSFQYNSMLCQPTIANILFDQLDRKRMRDMLPTLMYQKFQNSQFFDQVVEQGSTFFGGFTQIVDYFNEAPVWSPHTDNIWNSVADWISNFIFSSKLDEVIPVANNLMNGAKRLLGNASLYVDMQQLVQGIHGLEKVRRKLLTLLSKSYPLKEILTDSQDIYRFLTSELNINRENALKLIESEISFQKIFSITTSKVKNSNCVVPDSLLDRYFCELPNDKLEPFVKKLTRNISLRPILIEYVETELEPLFAKYGLPKNEMQQVWISTRALPTVLPFVADAFRADFVSKLPNSDLHLPESWNGFAQLLCGRSVNFSAETSAFDSTEEKTMTQVDKLEMNDLPSTTGSVFSELDENYINLGEFCRNLYSSIVRTATGSAVWKILKPLIRGRIAVAPKTPETLKIIEMANRTFFQFQRLADLAKSGVQSTESILRFNSSTDLKFITHALSHPLVGTILRDVAEVDSSQFVEALKGFETLDASTLASLSKLAAVVANATECVLTNRFMFFDDEQILESSVRPWLANDTLLAGIVFNSIQHSSEKKTFTKTSKRAELPHQIDYAIRMVADRVPDPADLLSGKLSNGKMNNPFYDLQYLYGFVLIQDAIDAAIIDIQSDFPDYYQTKMFVQQMPYPCMDKDEFAHHLTLWLPLFMVFAWMFCIGINVDALTHESELGLSQMMRSMGLSGSVQWLSWFVSSFCITFVASVFIVILLNVGQILTYSNGGLILLLMIDFELAILMMSYLISVCFTKSTLATVTGVILYLMAYLPYVVSTSPGKSLLIPFWAKILTCLSAPTAFSYACLRAASLEERGIGLQWSNLGEGGGYYEISFSLACWLILGDSALYCLIAAYISRLKPKSGEPERTLTSFCLIPSIWKYIADWYSSKSSVNSKIHISNCFEESNLVSVRHLSKSYDKKTNYRVFDLTFDMNENEVTTLLGPNGAGKTTTINMLTGVCQPTSGTAYIYGQNILSNSYPGRALVGLCPQFNILFDQLTVIEHLEFYGKLKGLQEGDVLKTDINRLLNETGLCSYAGEYVYKLSGGTRRRVCVAVAFVGGSRCVVLDEPTAGVDPLARRQIWEIIRTQKVGRTVLLCTHFMDEAEELSDSVAILQKGKLLCCAKPQKLKESFGYGSLLKVIRTKNIHGTSDTSILLSTIKECIPDVQLVEDIGRVLCVAIPFRKNAISERCRQIKNFAERIDSLKSYLGIENYEIRQSTLEEVVVIVCKISDLGLSLNADISDRWKFLHSDKTVHYQKQLPTVVPMEHKKIEECERPSLGRELKFLQFKALIYKRLLRTKRDWRLMISGLLLPCLFVALAMACNVMAPRFNANAKIELSPELYGQENAVFFSNDNPQSELSKRFVDGLLSSEALGSLCSKNRFHDNCKPSDSLFNTSYISDKDKHSYTGLLYECHCQYSNQVCPMGAEGLIAPRKRMNTNSDLFNLTQIQEKYGVNGYLMKTHQYFLHKRYGGFSFGESVNSEDGTVSPYVTVWFSSSDSHTLPSFFNGASNVRLRSQIRGNSSDYGISCVSHPLKIESSSSPENVLQRVADVGIALVLLAAYSLIPANLIIYVVQERMSKQRQLQKLSGVGDVLYWSTNFLCDYAFYCGSVLLGCIIIAIFKLPSFTYNLNLPATALLLLLYGAAVLPLMYIMQSHFKDGTVAFVSLFCFNLFTGINTMVCVMLLTIFSSDKDLGIAASVAKKAFLIFPQYAMGGGLVDLAYNQIETEIYQNFNVDRYRNPFGFDVLGFNYLALVLEFIIISIGSFVIKNRFLSSAAKSRSCVDYVEDEDEDVAAERKTVYVNGSASLLKVENLSKKYNSSKRWAVDKLCFHLNKGECFGLLGLNGAGKTTTFEMLTGGVEPSFGSIYLNGEPVEITSGDLCSDISYCPQENACDALLTVRETLEIYGMLRGYRSKQLREVVDDCINSLRLNKYESRLTGILSGGYKRLVCFAVSLLGDPKVILLDEPTAGVDSKTRRLVWERVTLELARGRAVFISTHSMEDSERLCTRLAIMADGRLRCLGTSTHLKIKFGYGYTIYIRLHSQDQIKFIKEDLKHKFQKGFLLSSSSLEMNYFIPGSATGLSALYTWVSSKSRLISNWNITESNLDELFINFIKKELDKDTSEKNNLPL